MHIYMHLLIITIDYREWEKGISFLMISGLSVPIPE